MIVKLHLKAHLCLAETKLEPMALNFEAGLLYTHLLYIGLIHVTFDVLKTHGKKKWS